MIAAPTPGDRPFVPVIVQQLALAGQLATERLDAESTDSSVRRRTPPAQSAAAATPART
jgi:hypothetical protein